jgi:hypothetical protein
MRAVLLLAIATCLVSAELPRREEIAHLAPKQMTTPGKRSLDTLSPYYASLKSKPRSVEKPIVKQSKHSQHSVAKIINDVSQTTVPSF